jgi:outer membrane protein TolC
MTLKKAFIYTSIVFGLITLLSYMANAQSRQLSMKEALSLTLANNREIRISSMDVDKSEQQTQVAKSASLPAAGISAGVAHYFYEAPFFGITNNSNNGNSSKILHCFGGRDRFSHSLINSQCTQQIDPES